MLIYNLINTIMKKEFKILIVLMIILILNSCNDVNETDMDIANIQNDPSLIEYITLNKNVLDNMAGAIQSMGLEQRTDLFSELGTSGSAIKEQTIVNIMGFKDVKNINEYLLSQQSILIGLKEKYYSKLNEEEFKVKFDIIRNNLIISEHRSGEPCQEAYESSFTSIHASYDSGVAWCTVLSMFNGHIGLLCFGRAVVTTLQALGEASDSYYACLKQI